MGPLSAVAIAFWLFIFGATQATWINASPHFYGVLGVIVAVVILIDAFWINSGVHYTTLRARMRKSA